MTRKLRKSLLLPHYRLAALKQAKEAFKASGYYNNNKIATLKRDMEKYLGVECQDQKRLGNRVEKNVFVGFRISLTSEHTT